MRDKFLLYLLRTVEKENKLDNSLISHLSLPSIQVILVSREAINQELVLATLLHCLEVKIELQLRAT